MAVPLVVLGALAAVGGIIDLPWGKFDFLTRWLAPVFPATIAPEPHVATAVKVVLTLLTLALCLGGLALGLRPWLRTIVHPKLEPAVLKNAWYFDAGVSAFMGGPGEDMANFAAYQVDKGTIDGAVNGVATLTQGAGPAARVLADRLRPATTPAGNCGRGRRRLVAVRRHPGRRLTVNFPILTTLILLPAAGCALAVALDPPSHGKRIRGQGGPRDRRWPSLEAVGGVTMLVAASRSATPDSSSSSFPSDQWIPEFEYPVASRRSDGDLVVPGAADGDEIFVIAMAVTGKIHGHPKGVPGPGCCCSRRAPAPAPSCRSTCSSSSSCSSPDVARVSMVFSWIFPGWGYTNRVYAALKIAPSGSTPAGPRRSSWWRILSVVFVTAQNGHLSFDLIPDAGQGGPRCSPRPNSASSSSIPSWRPSAVKVPLFPLHTWHGRRPHRGGAHRGIGHPGRGPC